MAAPMMVRSPHSAHAAFRRSSEAISSTWKSCAAFGAGSPRSIHAAHQAVRSQNLQARRVHVDEGHHYAVRAGQAGILVAKGQGGLVAVVAVGDHQLFVRHQLLEWRPPPGIFQTRWITPYSSVTSARGGGGGSLVQQRIDGACRGRDTA